MIFSLFAILLQGATAPTATPIADPCAIPGDCRVAPDFELRGPGGQRLPVRMGGEPRPWTPLGNLMIFTGESVTIRLETDGGDLLPRLVRAGEASAKQGPRDGEMRVDFRQTPDAALQLTVESRLDQPIDYDLITVSAVSGPHRSPTRTIEAGRTTTERWTGAIAQVAMANFHVSLWASRASDLAAKPRAVGGRVYLPLGSSAVLSLNADGDALRPQLVGSGQAAARLEDPSVAPLLAAAVRAQDSGESQEQLVGLPKAPGVRLSGPEADQIRFSFGPQPNGRTLVLMAESGHAKVLDYRASLRFADGRRSRTTVCRLTRGIPIFETWKGSIVALELEGFDLLEAAPNPQSVQCD